MNHLGKGESMNHLGTGQLETERLILRAFRKEDAPAMYRNWASDPEVTKFLTWPPHRSEEITAQLLACWEEKYQEENYYSWAIVPKALGEPVGSISVVEIKKNTGTAVIGYCIGKRWWHQGITSEAFTRVIRYLFDEAGFRRIEAQHAAENPHSGMVMKKCGLRHEGTLRGAGCNNQGFYDLCVYGILKEDVKS